AGRGARQPCGSAARGGAATAGRGRRRRRRRSARAGRRCPSRTQRSKASPPNPDPAAAGQRSRRLASFFASEEIVFRQRRVGNEFPAGSRRALEMQKRRGHLVPRRWLRRAARLDAPTILLLRPPVDRDGLPRFGWGGLDTRGVGLEAL